jgi:thymidylate synthase ThyX
MFAKVLCDSTSWVGKRLVTFHLKYPRYIHSELLTHRVFSKNSASSRAVPIEKFIQRVQDQPVKPIWTKNQKGMQGPVIEDGSFQDSIWLEARNASIQHAHTLNVSGVHKQNVNRLLEPWLYIEVVLTGTDFENFFELRDHEDAQPEIKALAQLMKLAMLNSTPRHLEPGEWHIPFSESIDKLKLYNILDPNDMLESSLAMSRVYTEGLLKVSVARCARVSYFNFDGKQDYSKDLELYDQLVSERPLHASPAEHQARAPYEAELQFHMGSSWTRVSNKANPGHPTEYKHEVGKYVSNLNGWIQLRKLIESGEFV